MADVTQINIGNGIEVPMALYKVVDMKLQVMLVCKPDIVQKLFDFCNKTPGKTLYAHDAVYLIELGFIRRNGVCYSISEDVRSIVLSSVRIDGLDIKLVDPRPTPAVATADVQDTQAEMPDKE